MSNSARWGSRASIAALLALLACGEPESSLVYEEDFESVCGDAPCGWQRLDSTTGTARSIEYEHPGEHGLQLDADVQVFTEPADAELRLDFSTSIQARVVARCDAAVSLSMAVLLVSLEGGPTLGPFEATLFPPSDGPGLGYVSLGLTDATTTPSGLYGIDVISFEQVGVGTCEIWSIEIDGPEVFSSAGC